MTIWYNTGMSNDQCAYCAEGEPSEAIRILDLSASRVYLHREQSHRGRVIVACRSHVGDLIDLPRRERQAFMDDVARVAEALRRIFSPQRIDYGSYGDAGGHLHFHLVPKYAADAFEWGEPFALNPQRTFLSEAEYADLLAKIAAELYVGDGFDFRKALESMRTAIAADGKVTLCESAILLSATEPLEGSGAVMDGFIRLLREVRRDGVVTPEESAHIIDQLNELLK